MDVFGKGNYTNILKELHTPQYFSVTTNLTTESLVIKTGYDYLMEHFDHREDKVEKYIEKHPELFDLLNTIVSLEVSIYCVMHIPGEGTGEAADELRRIRSEKITLFNGKSKLNYKFYNKDVAGL